MTEATERLSSALADRYRIERRLGEGGMATVYLAEDLKHKRKVAVNRQGGTHVESQQFGVLIDFHVQRLGIGFILDDHGNIHERGMESSGQFIERVGHELFERLERQVHFC